MEASVELETQRQPETNKNGNMTTMKETKSSMTYLPMGVNLQKPQLLPPTLCLRRFYLQIIFLVMAILILVLVRMISNMRFVFVQYHVDSDTDGELVILPEKFVHVRGSVCLDGTPPGYYLRKGKTTGVNSWILHLQSGAWCSSPQDCYDRSTTALGSSALAPISTVFEGLLSASESENPDFHTWNMVTFLYCDGASFAGTRLEPVVHNSKKLYLRGYLVFTAILDHLLQYTDLGSADQVILMGSSAGGLAALIHADYLRRKLIQVRSVHVVVDGGLFIDLPNRAQHHWMARTLKNAFELHRVTDCDSIKECTMGKEPADRWKCFLPENFYKHLFTPAFFVNSLYDTWYLFYAIGVTCSRYDCPIQDMPHIEHTRAAVTEKIRPILSSSRDGVFLYSCTGHTVAHATRYSTLQVNGTTLQQALGSWYFHRTKQPVKVIGSKGLKNNRKQC